MSSRIAAALLCSAALVGCDAASEPEFNVVGPERVDLQTSNTQDRNPLLGVWALTSAAADEEIDLPPDFSLILTFRNDGTYSLAATNTFGNFVCEEPVTSCTIYGTYEYTATTLTLIAEEGPAPELGRDTGLYALCGGRLIYLDFQGDEEGIRLTFTRTRRDCYVRDCS